MYICMWIMFWKRAFQIYSHLYTFMKNTFPKFDLRTWHWHCKLDFLNGAYGVLEKSSS